MLVSSIEGEMLGCILEELEEILKLVKDVEKFDSQILKLATGVMKTVT